VGNHHRSEPPDEGVGALFLGAYPRQKIPSLDLAHRVQDGDMERATRRGPAAAHVGEDLIEDGIQAEGRAQRACMAVVKLEDETHPKARSGAGCHRSDATSTHKVRELFDRCDEVDP
jgi:hypothetical protein